MFEKLKSQFNKFYNGITKVELKGERLNQIMDDFKINLIENDVAFEVADKLQELVVERLLKIQISRTKDKKNTVKEIFKETVADIIKTSGTLDLLSTIETNRKAMTPTIILYLGVNGTGKTTSIAKTAHYLLKKN